MDTHSDQSDEVKRLQRRIEELAETNEALNREIAERRRAEEVLRQRELESRLIVDNIPALVSILTPTGGFEFLNRQTLDYTGKTLEQLMNWGTGDAVHPEDLSYTAEQYTKGIGSGEPFEIVYRMRRFDGVYRWFEGRHRPMRDHDGRVVRWFVSMTDIDDRKRAEDALRASERNLKLTINTIPALAWSARLDGTAEFFNQHYLDYIGLSTEQAQDWGWTAAVHPDDLGVLAGIWQTIMASGKAGEAEARLRRFDGEYRWFLFRASPLRDETGNIVKWYGVNTDIEERKSVEQALRQSEAQLGDAERELQLTIDTIPVFVAIYQPDGTRTFVNRTWQEYMGLTLAEATGISATTFPHFHPADVERNDKAWHAALASGEPLSIEVRVRRADGQYRWHLSQRVPLRSERGDILQWYSVGIDIDDQKRAEEALHASELESRLIVDSVAGLITTFTPTGELEGVNQQFLEYYRKPLEEMKQWGTTDAVHPEDRPGVFQIFRAAIASGEPYEFEARLRRFDGVYRSFHVRGLPLRDTNGRIVRWYSLLTDIEDRKRAEERIRSAQAELAHVARAMTLGALTASIAHEVNQPLAGIIMNASTCLRMLAADPPNIDGAQETARRTIRDGNRAADVIMRLRALFANKAAIREPVDLNDAAREVIALLSSDLYRSRVVLRAELANDLPLVSGDRVQLQQVIMNLLRNAADAMSDVEDRLKQMVIRTEPNDDHVQLSVEDAGVGFGPQSAERLFEAFYTTKSEGMGIGLSVSRSIIESHNGRLWAVSNDGPGATFAFSIPRSSERMPASEEGAVRTPATPGEPIARGLQ